MKTQLQPIIKFGHQSRGFRAGRILPHDKEDTVLPVKLSNGQTTYIHHDDIVDWDIPVVGKHF